MKQSNLILEVQHIIVLGNNIIYFLDGLAIEIATGNSIEYNKLGYVRNNNELLAIKETGEFKLYNSKLEKLFNIECDKVTPMSGLIILDKANFLVLNFVDGYEIAYIKDRKIVITKQNFWGVIINQDCRLNFPEGTFTNPRTFRCSDLLDEVTYWEYDCGEGYTAARFNVWQNTLVFTKSRDLDSYLLMIDLPTGDILWETSIPYPDFVLDEETGLLVSVWGNEQAGNNYQVANLNKKIIEGGELVPQYSFHSVNLAHSFIDAHYLYFTDSPIQYGDKWLFETPRIGCFDFINKTLVYYKEIHELKEKGINQMLVKDDIFYFRTPENELYIFKDDTVV